MSHYYKLLYPFRYTLNYKKVYMYSHELGMNYMDLEYHYELLIYYMDDGLPEAAGLPEGLSE